MPEVASIAEGSAYSPAVSVTEANRLTKDGKLMPGSFLVLPENQTFTDWEKLNPMVVFYMYAGYGHAFEAQAVADSFAHQNIPALMVNIWEVVGVQTRAPLQAFTSFYERYQRSTAAVQKDQFPKVPKPLLRHLAKLFNFFETPLCRDLENFLGSIHASAVVATHPVPAGALSHSQRYREQTINYIPDPFGRRGRAGLAYSARGGIKTLVFDESSRQILKDVYGVEDVSLLETPVPLGLFDKLQKERQMILTSADQAKFTRSQWEILVGIARSGAFKDDVRQVIRDLAAELERGDKSEFKLHIFVGTDKAFYEEISDLVTQLGLKDTKNIEVIYSENILELARKKYELQAGCEIAIEKAGEPALIVPWLGSILSCLGFTSPHEMGNWLTGFERTGLVKRFERGENALKYLKRLRFHFEKKFKIVRDANGQVINPKEVYSNLNQLAPYNDRQTSIVDFVRQVARLRKVSLSAGIHETVRSANHLPARLTLKA